MTVHHANTFTINVPNVCAGTYSQNTNVITVTNSGHGLLAGYPVYLTFTSGGAVSGQYTVATDSIRAPCSRLRHTDSTVLSGNCLLLENLRGRLFAEQHQCHRQLFRAARADPNDTFISPTSAPPNPATAFTRSLTVPDATHFTLVVDQYRSTPDGQSSFQRLSRWCRRR